MRKWFQSSVIDGGSQWYEDDMPVCPICNKRINADELYYIDTGPIYHYDCRFR